MMLQLQQNGNLLLRLSTPLMVVCLHMTFAYAVPVPSISVFSQDCFAMTINKSQGQSF
eukprot:NODE_12770_length_376_cov_2.480122_g11618_i0.p2 GENE.NODE_12770_length_376_cov_2.480122_g11618_i0~~NODE_12770_length_376_cov_2.480122_g11618_i0.p2  ORF type:complete len:58 (+),score=4.49 NODE_12770_length_376_cov_2.480122_g11618_i0:3-176(+)